jgi:hypothetical protein
VLFSDSQRRVLPLRCVAQTRYEEVAVVTTAKVTKSMDFMGN